MVTDGRVTSDVGKLGAIPIGQMSIYNSRYIIILYGRRKIRILLPPGEFMTVQKKKMVAWTTLFQPEDTRMNRQIVVRTDNLTPQSIQAEIILSLMNKEIGQNNVRYLSARHPFPGNITLQNPQTFLQTWTTPSRWK